MKTFLKLSLVLAVMALPGLALATGIYSLTGTADCDGFSAETTIRWGTALTGTVTYNAVLVDDTGATAANVTVVQELMSPGNYIEQTVWFMQAWGVELCGTYTATVTVTMEATSARTGYTEVTTEVFQGSFVCECPTDACNYTPGYWKNHPENWPVMELTVGGVTYDQVHLLAIMDTPVRGDATIILAYHLIAAKLNVLNGSDPSINGAITEADNLLMQYPFKSKPNGDARDMILDVKNQLAGYNELGCPGDLSGTTTGDKDFVDESQSSWGQLKANYR